MKKTTNYRIFLWSEMKNNYAPSLHPTNTDMAALARYARTTLKLEENLNGKSAFEIHPDGWMPRH